MGATAVTFRVERPAEEKRVMKSFRVPASLDRYMRDAAKQQHIDQSEVLFQSLKLNRDLSARLEPVWSQIQAIAKEWGLDLSTSLDALPDALARLTELGIAQVQANRRKK